MTSRPLLLVASLLLTACSTDPPIVPLPDAGTDAGPRYWEPEPFTPTPETIAYCGERDDAEIEARITEILGRLSLDEKIVMLHGEGIRLTNGVWAVRGNEREGLPGLHMLDGPRGVSSFTGLNATAFPVGMMRGATWDPSLERRVGVAMARELLSVGGDVLLAPTINILRHPRWGRAQETYSEDSHHMAEMAIAFVEGVQGEGVIASAKHFAVNSIEDTRHTVDVQLDERTLREVYLPHFRRVVQEARVGSVMSAYNSVNGFYCDLNTHLLSDILKGEWGFAGFVESDWVLGTHGDGESLRAGLDIDMPAGPRFRRLGESLAAGEITEAEIDGAVRRVMRAQLCFDLGPVERPRDVASERETAEHLALAREVATRGIVLLRNRDIEGSLALPIERASVTRIALLGRNADAENIGDTGSSSAMPTAVTTALEGLRAAAGSVAIDHVTTLDAAGEAMVRAADVAVIVTGLTAADEGESTIGAGDRESLALPEAELALIRAVAAIHSRVIVVLEGGAAILTSEWEDEVEALLFAFYPGSEGGDAIAAILFGDAEPSGRLPFSIPAAESDLPPFDNTSTVVTYEYLHGYRHLAHEGHAPAHPFGSGLAYTTFELSELALADDSIAADGALELSVRVTNTGARAGRETVQLYVAPIGSSVLRAPEDLRAFAQVELAAGASEVVTLRVPARDLAIWDEDLDAWRQEPIEHEARIGRHAGDALLTARFRVE